MRHLVLHLSKFDFFAFRQILNKGFVLFHAKFVGPVIECWNRYHQEFHTELIL